jgi:chromosome segregation ATPase
MFGRVEQADFDNYKKKVDSELSSIKNEIGNLKSSVSSGLDALRAEMKATATVSDEVARQAAANAAESEKKIKGIEEFFTNALKELNSLQDDAKKLYSSVANVESSIVDSKTNISDIIVEAKKYLAEINDKKSAIEIEYARISEKAVEFNSYLEQSKDLPKSLEDTKGLLEEGKKLVDGMQSLLTHALKRKGEIDDLYKEIYGEDISDSEGKTEHTSGKKDELDAAYITLRSDITQIQGTVNKTVESIRLSYLELQKKNSNEFDELLKESKTRYDDVDTQLKGLLPGAMAAGLSAAYEEKKVEEIESLRSFDTAFRFAIVGMVAISCIPAAIDIYLVHWKDIDLLKVLKDTPTLLFAILPLYFPVLWMAYSSNKKSNLSKRLIEEYTHKSVLGKTYSGLANQIENLQQHGEVKDELRTKLLFNVLQVSAENPGKLITNYSKSDHPLMDALENSVKLADSVSALAKIPGFSAIATKLAAKADRLLEENTEKVKRGVDTQEALEKGDKSNSDSEDLGDDSSAEERKKAA